jgi:Fe-S cluster assembly protein SufD
MAEARSTKPGAVHRGGQRGHAGGAGAGDGRSVDELRAAALEVYEAAEMPTWRRSGFWTTSLRDLDLDALEPKHHEAGRGVPEIVREAVGEEPVAGLLVQRGASVVHRELDPELADSGVVLTSLEDAAREHPELVAKYFMRRLTYDRDKLDAAATAFWSGGAFLYVPPGVTLEREGYDFLREEVLANDG